MEDFFTPSQRFGRIEPQSYRKVELAVSIKAFLNHSWDWSDFRAFAMSNEGEMGKRLLIIKDAFIWVEVGNTRMECDTLNRCEIHRATLTAPSGETLVLVLAPFQKYGSSSRSFSTGGSSLFWRSVTTSNCVKLKLDEYNAHGRGRFNSETALLQFLPANPSLHLLEFDCVAFKEADCRPLATLERASIEVTFEECSFDTQGAEDTFI